MFWARGIGEWIYCSFPEWLAEQIQIVLSPELWVSRLPSNYNVAKRRFSLSKFQNNVPLYEKYSDVIKEYVSEGIVENVVTDNPTYYLPHRAVIKEERLTTK